MSLSKRSESEKAIGAAEATPYAGLAAVLAEPLPVGEMRISLSAVGQSGPKWHRNQYE